MRISAGAIFLHSLIFSAAIGALLMFPHTVRASASQNVSGWAWSENMGWISFNNTSGGGAVDYGVNVDTTTGIFSGYAWSENIGWISFNRADTGVPPTAPYNGSEAYVAKMDLGSFQITGWARALAQDLGWDGWIKFAGTAQDGSSYGVTIDDDTGEFTGFAFGGDVLGWISFNCANTNSCGTVSYSVKSPFAPIAHWKFNDGSGTSAADSSGNNLTATVTGLEWQNQSACKLGACIGTDSDNDFITIPSSLIFDTSSAFTYSTWVKLDSVYTPNSGNRWPRVMANYNGDTHKGYGLRYWVPANSTGNDGHLYFEWGNSPCDGSLYSSLTLGSNLLDNTWHFASATYDGATVKTYLDGVLKNQATHAGGLCPLGSNSMKLAERLTDGTPDIFLDESKVYAYARSDNQILAEYSGLVAHFTFDEGAGTVANDSSGRGHTGTITGASWRDESLCRAGKCLFYDGAGDYTDAGINSDLKITGAFSETAWIYPIGFPASSDAGIMGTGINGGYSLTYHTDGNVYFYLGNGTNKISAFASPNRWHHVAGVWDGTTLADGMKLYIDGALAGRGSSFVSAISPSRNFLFGKETSDFNGFIDEAKLYNRALSSAEVAQEFGSVSSNLVLRLKMDDNTAGNGKTITDSSGNGNNGTANWGANAAGMDCEVLGRQGGACLFDGVDDYLTVADAPSLNPTTFTITGWVYWNGGGQNLQNIVSKMNYPAEGYRLFYYSDGTVRLSVGNGAGDVYVATFSGALPITSWTHVGGVYDGASLTLYINGVAVSSAPMTGSLAQTARSLTIGSYNDNEESINGMLDEVRLYSSALTIEQMYDDYQKGFAPVSEWKLDDGSGTVARDESENKNDGELFGPVWRSGGECVFGGCLSFDGANDYVDAWSEQSLKLEKALTLEAWIKPNAVPSGADSGIAGTGIGGFALTYNNDGKVWFYIDSGANNLKSAIPSDSAWHHVAGVWNGTTGDEGMTLYVDGEIKEARASLSSSISGWQNFTIGSATTKFKGYIDDVRVYNYARSESEIRLDYAAAFPLATPLNVLNPAGAEFNTLVSVIFHWDPVPLATTYYVYVLTPDLNWTRAGITNTPSFFLTTNNPLITAPLVSDTLYDIKVIAVDDVGQSPQSDFSDIGIAATSANAPMAFAGAPSANAGEVLWSWQSGGRDSGYFAELATDSEKNSGWMPIRFSDGSFTRAFGYRLLAWPSSAIAAQKGILITQYDDLRYSYGSKLLDGVYENFNPGEGTLEAWIQTHWDSNDGKTHTLFDGGADNFPIIEKTASNAWRLGWIGGSDLVTVSASHTAGDFIHIVASFDVDTKLNGANYARLTINGAHAYGGLSALTPGVASGEFIIGNNTDRTGSIDALVAGRILGRALSESEIDLLYAGGNGSPATFSITADTLWLLDSSNDKIDAVYDHQGQGVISSTASQVTLAEVIGLRSWADNDAVSVYDGTAYSAQGFIAGSLTGTEIVIPIDDGIGGVLNGLANVGGLLTFNGQTDYILFGNQPTLNMGTADLTIAAWIRTTDANGTGVIFGKKQGGGIDEGYRLALKDGRVSAGIADGIIKYNADDGDTINDGLWHHVAAVFDRDGSLTRYIDGTATGTPVVISSLNSVDISNSFQAGIGSAGLLGSELFDGDIAEVHAYNQALTLAQVQSLWNNPKKNFAEIKTLLGFTDSDVRGLWQLYKNTAPTVTDASANGNNGTITGAAYRQEAVIYQVASVTERVAPTVATPSTREQSGIIETATQAVPHQSLPIVSISNGSSSDTITVPSLAVSAFQTNDPIEVFDGTSYAVAGRITNVLSDTTVIVDDGFGGNPQTEKVGIHATFNGSEMAQMSADSDILNIGTGDISISVWIKTADATSDGSNRIVSKMDGNVGYEIYMNDISGKIGLAIGDISGNVSGGTVSSAPVNDGAWHHIAVTFDRDGTATVYKDGISDGTLKITPEDIDGNPLPIASADNAAKFTVGADSDGKRNFTGAIRDARILRGGLWSAGEIAAQAVNPWQANANGTNTEYWLFNGSPDKTVSAGVSSPAHDLQLTSINEWQMSAFIQRTNTGVNPGDRPNDPVVREWAGMLIDGNDALTFPAKNILSNKDGTIALSVKLLLPGSLAGSSYSPVFLDAKAGVSRLFLGHDGANNQLIRYIVTNSAGADATIGSIDISSWPANEWHSIVLQWDAYARNEGRIYIDGNFLGVPAPVPGVLDDFSGSTIFIGTDSDSHNQSDAYFDGVYVLNHWVDDDHQLFSKNRVSEWTMQNANCGAPFTGRVTASNRDGDTTSWVEGYAEALSCSLTCLSALDCGADQICALLGAVKTCKPKNYCELGAWCNKLFNVLATDGICVADGTAFACNLPPSASLLIKSIDHAADSITVSAETSTDDLTPTSSLETRWDFEYSGAPNWGSYISGVGDVSHTYTTGDGVYTIALQAKDEYGSESAFISKSIIISNAGDKIIAIYPESFPATNVPYVYNFGAIKTGDTKSLSMLVCNLGGGSLNVSSLSFAAGAEFSVSGTPPSFTLFPDADGPPPECSANNDALSYKFITLKFSPVSDGIFGDTFTITSDSLNGNINVALNGEARTVSISPDAPVEDVIYEGRTLINPPPGFVEFLEELRFVEPAKSQ